MISRSRDVSALRSIIAATSLMAIAGFGILPLAAQEAQTQDLSQRLPPDTVTQHALDLPDRKLEFLATAGTIPIANSKGQKLAEIGFVAYTLNDTIAERRPVTFALNGGPGSASAWLHIGTLGPWRIRMEEAAASPSAPAPLIPNIETWLDFTDLVFIDPVGTGFSQITPPSSRSDDKGAEERTRRRGGREGNREEGGGSYFWSIGGDVESIAEVMHKWLKNAGRLNSPKLLVGESYGGFRGPRIARTLESKHGVALNALVLVSPVLDFAGRRGSYPPMTYVALLPSLAAAEMERKGEDLDLTRLREVEEYARTDYLEDLMRGPRNPDAVSRIVTRVSEITGLREETVKRYGGRISGRTYDRAVNRPKGKVASMYDASIRSLDPEPYSSGSRYRDPFTSALNAPMTTVMLRLYGDKLNYRTDRPYVKMSSEVNRSWIWGNSPSSPESVSYLREALALDPHLRVLVVHGYTDLVTPYFASEMVLDQLPTLGDGQRVSSKVYPGGHMFYSRDTSRKAFREDAFNLVERIVIESNNVKPPARSDVN